MAVDRGEDRSRAFGEGYLTRPAEAVLAGAPASGRAGLVLELVGGPYTLSGMSAGQLAVVEQLFADHRGQTAAGSIPVRFRRAEPAAFVDFPRRGWCLSYDLAFTPTSVTLAGRRFVARLEWAPALAVSLALVAEQGPEVLEIAQNLLRVVVAYRLLELGGALLHSAAVVSDGGARVFYGPSGAGKTTLSGLALRAGQTVLGDDVNGVRREAGRALVEALPLGDSGRDEALERGSFPLAGLYRLEHGRANRLLPIGRAEALATLVACAPFVNRDRHRLEHLEANLSSLLDSTASGRLGVARDARFGELLGLVAGAA